jgi:glycine/D-amino acid oxidase-like deaminating enzyme/nitrite reductase/ring-hydroxylating ferredoxin subunit
MPAQIRRHSSLWMDTAPARSGRASFGGEDLLVDVAIIGGGITGISVAFTLAEAGRSVAILEMRGLAEGATGFTTAKVTSGHNLIYRQLSNNQGPEAAQAYADANDSALATMRRWSQGFEIECAWEERANFVYASEAEATDAVREEAEAARAAGLAASFVETTELPLATFGAVRLEGQAQFHPRRYLLGLAAEVERLEGLIFEDTRVLDFEEGEPCVIETERGTLHAKEVVFATRLPISNRGHFYNKTAPYMSYAVAFPFDGVLAGMYINTTTPFRSLRTARDGDRTYLIVGGEGHKVGDEADTDERYEPLVSFAAQFFGLNKPSHRWCTHDMVSVDHVPFIGRLDKDSKHLWVATGFGKWGMTTGTVAGLILRDRIIGQDNGWSEVFDSTRSVFAEGKAKLLEEGLDVAKHFVLDSFRDPKPGNPLALGSGEGAIVRVGGEDIALFRDEGGGLHAFSGTCTHMGCLLRWNAGEQTWDCPCHGSRFDAVQGTGHGRARDPRSRAPDRRGGERP